jgi:hypothetical protein
MPDPDLEGKPPKWEDGTPIWPCTANQGGAFR